MAKTFNFVGSTLSAASCSSDGKHSANVSHQPHAQGCFSCGFWDGAPAPLVGPVGEKTSTRTVDECLSWRCCGRAVLVVLLAVLVVVGVVGCGGGGIVGGGDGSELASATIWLV